MGMVAVEIRPVVCIAIHWTMYTVVRHMAK